MKTIKSHRRVLRLLSGTAFLTLLLVTVGSARTATRSKHAAIEPPAPRGFCPFQTPEEWQRFLDRYADSRKWVETCEDSACDEKYYAFVKFNVQRTFEQCSGFIAQHENIERCTRNLRRFTPAWLRQHDSVSYGFNVNNHIYLSRQDAPDKPPGMMKPPDAIIAALPDRGRVEEAARRAGLKYLTHDSALGGYRTFVLITDPQDRFDQWMLLNLQAGKKTITDGTPLSILVVQKRDRDGNRLSKVRVNFRDYTLFKSHNRYHLELQETNNGKCYSCHSNGVRQLIARHTPILQARPVQGEAGFDNVDFDRTHDFAFSRLMEFNKRLRSYGGPDWESMINPADHGPALGREQGCMDCHDGKSRGVLTVSTSPAQLEQKMVHELSMPPDTDLPHWLERKEMKRPGVTDEEALDLRRAFLAHEDLLQEFNDSRFPALKKWFLETSCR